MKKNYLFVFLLLLNSFLGYRSYAQNTTIVKGNIQDKLTKEPVPFASVMFVGSTIGTNSGFEGDYQISSDNVSLKQLKISFVGYKTLVLDITPGTTQTLDVQLEQEAKQLQEVSVKADRLRYRNKNNPAVDLINLVIDNKPKNKSDNYDFYEHEKYEKIQFALSNVSEKFKNRAVFKNFKFIFEGMDSTKLAGGKPVLPMYIKETISDVYFRKNPKKEKQIIKGDKMISFEGYVDDNGIDNYLKNMYQHIDIYENDITMLTNQFLSPIAKSSPLFYKFFILDTVVVDQQKLINLAFMPRNPNDFLFQGNLYITLDSAYAVRKLDMSVNSRINLNWVKELKIKQEFEKDDAGYYSLTKDDFMADFGLGKGSMGIFGQKTVSYKNIKINQPRYLTDYEGAEVEVREKATEQDDSFWQENRHGALSASEEGIYTKIDSVKKVPAFTRSMDLATLLLISFKSFGPVEMGPVNTFYSFNPVEGFRLRFGGRTTPQFSKKIVLDAYTAYGFKDQQWKYYVGATYSFTDKTIYDFPVRSLKISYQKDTKIPGQSLQFVQEDNFLLSFKRGVNDKWSYNDIVQAEYLHEYKNHFSFLLGYKYWIQYPGGSLNFNFTDYNDNTSEPGHLTTSEFSLNLRWAPKEKFYQSKLYRSPIYNKYPIFSLRYAIGLRDVFNGEFNYQSVTFSAFKRVYLSQVGYTNILLEGGQLIGKVPFPLLNIHRANQSYDFQFRSYNLMNFLEFVSDRYAGLNIDHYFNGFFFNKVPLMKRLKWREVATFKLLYGDLRKENNPAYTDDILRFPEAEDGTPITHTFANKPYMEGSIGVANIFKFLRVDLVKRFNYLSNPHVSGLGVRASFKFDF
ncbi:carboxypeptidase-like regulatory domain-containing protein [Emticicia sp. CRIBPO]|uniref:DUF5686 and carboxypeptidase-like regulatory domain-containing protein n=1 Tax=Emticicia sp. CRIBPO TaxID=2683258 RepID=UPI001412FFC8|nr:DUF5686 and carboxypeptidase-like regulatory domain-containing protein [Emticicia sp. CRIBPO]NBA89030.1 carboxypeptidase-like regulatory domain-containing protein [Emticicia sp. CRIBPO]